MSHFAIKWYRQDEDPVRPPDDEDGEHVWQLVSMACASSLTACVLWVCAEEHEVEP